jgi:phage terminase large subunit GpA-like protein
MTEDDLSMKLTRLKRGTVPAASAVLVAFIDPGLKVMHWCVVAFRQDFHGAVVDYGRETKHYRRGEADEANVWRGLTMVTDRMLVEYPSETGTARHAVSRCMVDAGWQTKTVYEFCRSSKHAGIIMPSMGEAVRPGSTFGYKAPPGSLRGEHFLVTPAKEGRVAVRLVRFDVGFWKSFLLARLKTGMGAPGSMAFFGEKASQHQQLFDHLTSETFVRVKARGIESDVWSLTPNRQNHWLDCVVGSCMAGAMSGCSILVKGEVEQQTQKPRRRHKVVRATYS